MARRKDPVKPLFDLKADYEASLERFIHQAGMLCDAARTLIQLGGDFPGSDILKERVAAFDAARFGQSEQDG